MKNLRSLALLVMIITTCSCNSSYETGDSSVIGNEALPVSIAACSPPASHN